MTVKIQVIIIILASIGILYTGNLVRVKRLELKYALVWFFVGVLVIIFAANKSWLQGLSNLLGIELPINMLFFVGFLFVIMIIFTQTIVISNLTRKSKRLTQEVAMLNKRIDDMMADNSIVSDKSGVVMNNPDKIDARSDGAEDRSDKVSKKVLNSD